MKSNRGLCGVLVILLLLSITGCGLTFEGNDNVTEPSKDKGVYINYSYAYSFVGDANVHVPHELQEKMEQFGDYKWIQQAVPITKTYTQIPETENNAKGPDPICIVMPELDLTKYDGPYIWKDDETGLKVSAYYRVVAGVLTDELVKVYVDSSGNIKQYETVNLGKYDNLNIDEQRIKGMCSALDSRKSRLTGDVILEYYAPTSHASPTWCILFTDTQDRIVLCTRGALKTDSEIRQIVRQVDLYAILE